jgi:hypothetical protein
MHHTSYNKLLLWDGQLKKFSPTHRVVFSIQIYVCDCIIHSTIITTMSRDASEMQIFREKNVTIGININAMQFNSEHLLRCVIIQRDSTSR